VFIEKKRKFATHLNLKIMAGIPISTEIINQNPELEEFREVVHLLENSTFKTLFPKKWEVSTLSSARERAHKLLKTHPDMSLKETLTTVLNGCEDGLSGEVLLKITEQVIKKWETLSNPIVLQSEGELQLA
jgi:hypothetical protein